VDRAGVFHKIPRIDDLRLAEVFAREILSFLVGREILSPEWADRILSWRHTGFSVHSLVRATTKSEAERVGKYMIRPLLSLERLSFDEKEGKVGYRWGRDGAEQETMDYEDEAYRLYHGVCRRGSHHRSPEADVCGGEAPAVSCLRAGPARGGRGERGIFLSFRDHGE